MPRNFSRSSIGVRGSSASCSTRRLNSSQLSSRFTYSEGCRRSSGASGTLPRTGGDATSVMRPFLAPCGAGESVLLPWEEERERGADQADHDAADDRPEDAVHLEVEPELLRQVGGEHQEHAVQHEAEQA